MLKWGLYTLGLLFLYSGIPTGPCSFFDYVLLEHGVQPHKIIVTALSLKMDFPILALTFMDLGFWRRTEELDSGCSIIWLVSVRKLMWWKTNLGNTEFEGGQARAGPNFVQLSGRSLLEIPCDGKPIGETQGSTADRPGWSQYKLTRFSYSMLFL